MTVFDWETAIAPRSVAFNRRGMSVGGPVSMSGRSQVAQYDAGYWTATLSRVNAAGPSAVKAYRRMVARLEGGAHQIRVPAFDPAQAPTPAVPGPSSTLFSDGTAFSDGTGFADMVINVTLASALAARSTNISATITNAGTIEGGELFSLRDRLHMVTTVNADGSWQIWPPTREALPAGEPLNFDSPHCLMRLANEGDDDLELEMGRYGFPDLTFVEVI